jgi:transcriptional regulator with XRE-family HTH domain
MAATTADLLLKYWGQSVRKHRGTRSQKWLADQSRCDQTTVSRIERGIYRIGPELMVALSVALDVELDELFPFPPGLMSRARYEREICELTKDAVA